MFTADRPTAEILRVEVTDTLAYWTVLAGPTQGARIAAGLPVPFETPRMLVEPADVLHAAG